MHKGIHTNSASTSMRRFVSRYKSEAASNFLKNNWKEVLLGAVAVTVLGIGIYAIFKSDILEDRHII